MPHRLSDPGPSSGAQGASVSQENTAAGRAVMTSSPFFSIHQDAINIGRPFGNLTHVDLTFRPKKIEHCLRFGNPIAWTVVDKRRSILSFKPDQVFAFVRWASNDYGTLISRLDIVRTIDRGESYQTLPSVRPGGEILLRVDSLEKVERVFQVIDAIETPGIYAPDVLPTYWRHVHNRLIVNQQPPLYSRIQHKALRLRAKVKP
jgi:Protein of unknown function (DUF2840)